MEDVLLFKGDYDVINMVENIDKANNLYNFVIEFFKKREYTSRSIETNSTKSVNDYISNDTKYLVGHSKGGYLILQNFKPEMKRNIKGIILFDPGNFDYNLWMNIPIKKIIFLSVLQSMEDIRNEIVQTSDDHYFSNSFDIIENVMSSFVE